MRTTQLRSRLAAAAAALTLGLTLAGCGADPDVVAYVGGERVTQTQVDEGVDGVNQALTNGNQIPAADVANVLIHGRLAEQIAAQRNITITNAQLDAALAQRDLTVLTTVPAAKQIGYDSAREQLVLTAVGQQEYLAELGKIQVTLNPRFGVLNPQTKIIVEGSSGSLSIPLARPSS